MLRVLGGDEAAQERFRQTDHGGSELITAETEGLRSVEISKGGWVGGWVGVPEHKAP